MNTTLRLLLVALLLVVAIPAYSGEAVQMWKCEMDEDTTEEQVEAHAQAWLTAAKKIEGGASLKAFVYFPVAVNSVGDTDFMFIVVAPSFAEWGKFWDNYLTSDEFAEVEKLHQDLIACPDSAVWESIAVK
jgi:hypothetical protein